MQISRKQRKTLKATASWKPLLGAMIALLTMAVAVPPAGAAEEPTNLAFNPTLSLTGDCTTSELDPVPDPGCPGGTHPADQFINVEGIAVDSYGDVYVGSGGTKAENEGVIDIFDPEGNFISELVLDVTARRFAVDSKGHLYLSGAFSKGALRRYDPVTYDPEAGQISYDPTPVYLSEADGAFPFAIAVDPRNDHVFVNLGTDGGLGTNGNAAVEEFASAEEGNVLLDPEVAHLHSFEGTAMAIDAIRGRLYVDDEANDTGLEVIKVFELAPPHNLIKVIDGSTTPDGKFKDKTSGLRIPTGVDESTGHLFVYVPEAFSLFELTAEGEYLATIEHGFFGFRSGIAIDNGKNSPNGALNPEGRTVWVTSGKTSITGHAFAFGPPNECAPVVETASVAHLSESEALLRADIEPCGLETEYRFEYVSAQQYAETGFAGASLAGAGSLPAGSSPVSVSAAANNLAPGTRYVFRVLATNKVGADEGEGAFRTYPATPSSGACPNQALRTGPSALLPDCRAYELVTPANTNGLSPYASGSHAHFPTRTVSLLGDSLFFRIPGGILPGTEGTGSLAGDPYLSTRGPGGWRTIGTGGRGSEFQEVEPDGRSPDLGYSAWRGIVNGSGTSYVRYPDGHSELLARGTLGSDPAAVPLLITEGGSHMVFRSTVRLEEQAPKAGRDAIYDRTRDGVTHVVSLLPGDEHPSEGGYEYEGASADGRGIAFQVFGSSIGETLYLRYDNQKTYVIDGTHPSGQGVTFEGVAEGGKRIFYLKEGKLYAFDVEAGTIPFTSAGVATVVNVAPDGSTVYFVSTSKLTTAANPLGDKAKIGDQNLYLSREGQIEFVARVTKRDVDGEGTGLRRDGLGGWSGQIRILGALPQNSSRISPDGSILVFESRANLTGYDSAGHAEIYRFDSRAKALACISCSPSEIPASDDSILQTFGEESAETPTPEPTWMEDQIANLTPDGRRVFFETTEPLAAADIDGLNDVYEWEENEVGSCQTPGGCVYLISSGRSAHDDYLYGVSESGNDVFIWTQDLLAPEIDPDETHSIYDARVNGGFATVSQSAECLGEACQPAVSPPDRPAQVLFGAGNVPVKHTRCRRGQRPVRRHGRTHCVKKRRGHPRHHRGNRHAANHGSRRQR
jgi:hypothetical protein